MGEKLIITPKDDKPVTMTLRVDKNLKEQYNALSAETNLPRNELVSMALRYALEHMELEQKQEQEP